MAYDAHKNFAVSTVATAPSPATSGTSLTVASGDGAKFPAVPFNAVCWPSGSQPTSSNAEIVRVTAISTDTFTITRAQESTSAQSIAIGWNIDAAPTAKTFTDIEANATGASTKNVIFPLTVGSDITTFQTGWINGSGTITKNANQNIGVACGTTASSSAVLYCSPSVTMSNGPSGDFSFTADFLPTVASIGDCFVGVGRVYASGSALTLTTDHAGFYVSSNGASLTWYASNGDGSAETRTSFVNGQTYPTLSLVKTSTSVKYYLGTTLMVTHTTNLPSSPGAVWCISATNLGNPSNFTAWVSSLCTFIPVGG